MEAPAVARDERRGSKYYHEPSSRSDVLRPAWRGEQPVNKPNACERCKGEKGKIDPETGEFKRCKVCGGTGLGEKPYAGGSQCATCHGSGQLKPGPNRTTIPAQRGEEGASACKTCGGTGNEKEKLKRPPGREGFFVGEWLNWFLEADPGYDPQKRTYTTNLHVQPEIIDCPDCDGSGKIGNRECPRCNGQGQTTQRLAKDIAQSFTRFKPSKAKTKELYGGPPAKNELEPWMKDPGSEEKELYHFDPIQVTRRDLFTRLQVLVNFLNFSSLSLTKPIELTPEELEGLEQEEIDFIVNIRTKQKEAANALFDQLRLMKTDDIAGFRDVLQKAEEFGYNVKHHPEMFTIKKNNGRVLRRSGDLVLRRCDDWQSALECGRKPAFNGIEPKGWCLKNEYNCKSYCEEGPIFYVERAGMAYVGIHPASGQAKDTQNTTVEKALSSQDAERIAPLLVPYAAELPEDKLRGEARHLADTVGALRHGRH
jgi:hypothetical protein